MESKPIKGSGSCHCGSSQYYFEGIPKFQFLCHCEDCRVLNSGGHLAGLILTKDKFNMEGSTQSYSYPGGSGNPIELHFCSNCGTHLYAFPKVDESIVVLRANTLLDQNLFNPQKSIFRNEKFHWDQTL